MIPLILNQAVLIEALEREKLINRKYVILEKLREEMQGIDNSLYIEMDVYFIIRMNKKKIKHIILYLRMFLIDRTK